MAPFYDVILFADETSILIKHKHEVLEEVANSAFNDLLHWFQLMAYQLIVFKTDFIQLHNVTPYYFSFGSEKLEIG